MAFLPHSEIKKNLSESMKEIEDQATYIGKIVADLQDYSQLLNPFNEEINLQNLIDNLLLSTELNENSELTSEIADNTQTIKADQDYLKRLLTNLITNAEQPMPNGGRITITTHEQKRNCLITVEDTGEDIPKDIKPHLFQSLLTIKSTGQGFGLAVSKRLANAMGGDLTSESEEGNCSKFTLKLANC